MLSSSARERLARRVRKAYARKVVAPAVLVLQARCCWYASCTRAEQRMQENARGGGSLLSLPVLLAPPAGRRTASVPQQAVPAESARRSVEGRGAEFM